MRHYIFLTITTKNISYYSNKYNDVKQSQYGIITNPLQRTVKSQRLIIRKPRRDDMITHYSEVHKYDGTPLSPPHTLSVASRMDAYQ